MYAGDSESLSILVTSKEPKARPVQQSHISRQLTVQEDLSSVAQEEPEAQSEGHPEEEATSEEPVVAPSDEEPADTTGQAMSEDSLSVEPNAVERASQSSEHPNILSKHNSIVLETSLHDVIADVIAPVPVEVPRLVITTEKLPNWDGSGCIYFVKKSHSKLTTEELDDDVEVGVLVDTDPLAAMERMLADIYIPVLIEQAGLEETSPDDILGVAGANNLDASLLSCLNKFLAQVRQTRQHLTGNIQLAIPDVDLEDADGRSDELLTQLEAAMNDWTAILQDVMQQEIEKTAGGTGPLDEIFFWRERNTMLGGLYEQARTPMMPFLPILCDW